MTISFITNEQVLGDALGEPGVIGIDGICTCCNRRSDKCECDAQPFYALQQLHRRIKAARGDFERAVMAQREAGIPHRQIAWQAGLTVNAVQTIERKFQ